MLSLRTTVPAAKSAAMFERRPAKLLFLYGVDPVLQAEFVEADAGVIADEVDRLPRKLFVRLFDLAFFAFAISTYVADFVSDIIIAGAHYAEGRTWSGTLILVPCVVCSLALNLVAIGFIVDDEYRYKNRERSSTLSIALRILACILQLGPVMYYCTAIYAGIRFRASKESKLAKQHFCKMIESERDATLLRFFEAFLESVPQLFVQGLILTNFFIQKPDDAAFPNWVWIQVGSLACSLLSACWSVSIQHRSLRMCRPDKVNMHPHESVLQLLWRFCTVSSRFIVLVFAISVFGIWMIPFFVVHFAISFLHITALQAVSAPLSSIEFGLIMINSLIHISTPFNMADGATKHRYFVAYTIEGVEQTILSYLLLTSETFNYKYKFEVIGVAAILFILGLIIMMLYYGVCHPNRRRHLRIEADDVEEVAPTVVQVNASDSSDSSAPITRAIVPPMPRDSQS